MDITKVDQIRSIKKPLTEVVLVDYSWLLHRSFHGYGSLSVKYPSEEIKRPLKYGTFKNYGNGITEVFTGDFYGSIRAINMLANMKPMSAIILCLDSPHPKKIRENPEYKGNRVSHPEVYAKKEEILETVSLIPNVFISAHPDAEADEILFTLAQKFAACLAKVTLYANDKDLYQSFIQDNIVMANKVEGRKLIEYGKAHAMERFNNLPPEKIAFFRSICSSDEADNLTAYPRFPRDVAEDIVRMYDNPQAFLDGVGGIYTAKTEARQAWVDLLRNKPEIMIKLYFIHRIEMVEDLSIFKGSSTWEHLKFYQCKSLESQIQKFISLSE